MEAVRKKGMPTAVVQSGNKVQIWVASPTGDSSDSQILEISCIDYAQAQSVYEMWCKMVWADRPLIKL